MIKDWCHSLVLAFTVLLFVFQTSISSDSNFDYRDSAPASLANAVMLVAELTKSKSYEVTICPPEQNIGFRPHFHPPNKIGTTCEGWFSNINSLANNPNIFSFGSFSLG